MKTRKQALQDEFNDLEEEFCFCGSRDERLRCASQMQAILAELSAVTPAQHRPLDEDKDAYHRDLLGCHGGVPR